MRQNPGGPHRMSRYPLGGLKSLIVISNWIAFTEKEKVDPYLWTYKKQKIHSVNSSSVIFTPVDFSRIIRDSISYILLYGAGIYSTKFSVFPKSITLDHRFITALVIPEEKWLDNHFNTEPFVFPDQHNFLVGDYLHEFPFHALRAEDDIVGQRRRAFSKGIILAQLVFPFKEPLLLLKKATESYEHFDSPTAPMRVLISNYSKIFNEISLEATNRIYQETIPGIRKIQPNLFDIFPEKWKNEVYISGLKREIAKLAKDFAFIGIPLILNS
ncbi:MAG: hypothetical protein EAX86_02300 [Candidatus Heimdallarchaeota archaeon]|nr:hypothetical protein [Candidatus Heimdallarchaeota archaeon]